MEALLKSISRKPEGASLEDVIANTGEGMEVTIVFRGAQPKRAEQPSYISGDGLRKGHEYIIKAKQWMTKATTDDSFDFMRHWNNNIPMPLRVMKGRVLKETRGMVYMELRACPLETDYCMKCGKPLTHPVSRLYGLGPECGGHFHINPFSTEEELHAALEDVQQKLYNVTWAGWIAKSGIEYATEIYPGDELRRKL